MWVDFLEEMGFEWHFGGRIQVGVKQGQMDCRQQNPLEAVVWRGTWRVESQGKDQLCTRIDNTEGHFTTL